MTSPQLASRPRPPARPATRDIDEQTEVGEVYMRSLLRSQLRQAVAVLGVVVCTLGGLPLLFAAVPGIAKLRLWTVPLPWLLLGVLVYPFLLAAAWWYVRLAERTEREFADLLDHQD